jgi:hypothetical protein
MRRIFIAVTHNWRREDGTASLEFVISFPVLLFIFLLAFESGMLMIRNIMLERAVDMTMRDLRLNLLDKPDVKALKDEICAKTMVIANCPSVIVINLEPVSTDTWNIPTSGVECLDSDEDFKIMSSANMGVKDNLMLVRACVSVDPLFPTTGLGLRLPADGNAGYWLTAVSAFVNEPS